jgi:hypothetical protein
VNLFNTIRNLVFVLSFGFAVFLAPACSDFGIPALSVKYHVKSTTPSARVDISYQYIGIDATAAYSLPNTSLPWEAEEEVGVDKNHSSLLTLTCVNRTGSSIDITMEIYVDGGLVAYYHVASLANGLSHPISYTIYN